MWEQRGGDVQSGLKNQQIRYFALAQKHPANAEYYLKRARQVWGTFIEVSGSSANRGTAS